MYLPALRVIPVRVCGPWMIVMVEGRRGNWLRKALRPGPTHWIFVPLKGLEHRP